MTIPSQILRDHLLVYKHSSKIMKWSVVVTRNMNESPHQLTTASHESLNMFREKECYAFISMGVSQT